MNAAKRSQAMVRVFGYPIIFNVMAFGGLMAGLVGDGLFDMASWLLLASPLVVVTWCAARARSEV